jgi:hypothetical protein
MEKPKRQLKPGTRTNRTDVPLGHAKIIALIPYADTGVRIRVLPRDKNRTYDTYMDWRCVVGTPIEIGAEGRLYLAAGTSDYKYKLVLHKGLPA